MAAYPKGRRRGSGGMGLALPRGCTVVVRDLWEGSCCITMRKLVAGCYLLVEPTKGLVVNPADLPWKRVKRLATSGERATRLMGKDVRPLQSVKLS